MTTEQKNILIAEFMGWKLKTTWERTGYELPDNLDDKSDLQYTYICPADLLRFDGSWDWLMPAWYKFRDIKVPYELQPLFNNYCAKIAQQMAYGGITNTYEALSWAIQWYNEQNKT